MIRRGDVQEMLSVTIPRARRARYLAALGIELWVRRDAPVAAPTTDDPEAPGTATASEVEARSAPPSGGEAPAPEAPPVPERRTLTAIEAGLDVPGPAPDAVPRESPEGGPPASPASVPEAAEPSAGETAAAAVPRFELCVVALGNGVLLVDEALLARTAGRRTLLQLLGDVLRTGVMLRGGAAGGRVAVQAFAWPQVEDPAVDQSLPRAVGALRAFARRRVEAAEDGLLVVVEPEPGLIEASTQTVLGGLDALGAPVVRVEPALVTAPDAAVRRRVWAALKPLATAGAGARGAQ